AAGTESQPGPWPPSSSQTLAARGSGWPVIRAGLDGSGDGATVGEPGSPTAAGLVPTAPGLVRALCCRGPGRYQMTAAANAAATPTAATASCHHRHRQ